MTPVTKSFILVSLLVVLLNPVQILTRDALFSPLLSIFGQVPVNGQNNTILEGSKLNKRGHEGVGSDIAPAYAGISDGSVVITMPCVGLDITDKEAVEKVISEIKPDMVVHCAAWTARYYLSTDYVFDGRGTEPWQPDCKN